MIRVAPSLVRFPPEPGDDPVNAVLRLVVRGFSRRRTTSVEVDLAVHGTVHLGVILPISGGPRLVATPTTHPNAAVLRFSQVEFAGEDELRDAAEHEPALFAKLLVSIVVDLELPAASTTITGHVVTEEGAAPFRIEG